MKSEETINSLTISLQEVRGRVVRITSLAWLVTLALSWPVYLLHTRLFKWAPVIDGLVAVPAWADDVIFALGIGCLVYLLIRPLRRLPAAGILLCALFWVLQDLLRFQTYVYLYFFTILFAVFFASSGVAAMRVMTASVYFWAGFYKLNATFVLTVFPWFISPLFRLPPKPSWLNAFLLLAGWLAPVFEAAIGILVFFPRFRRLATLMAFLMMMVILFCVGPLGRNAGREIWPWNIQFFLIEFVLFYKIASLEGQSWLRLDVPVLGAIIVFTVAPAFALCGWWPSYPAFKLYSGNVKLAKVIFAPDEQNISRLPEKLGRLVHNNQLSVTLWNDSEFGMSYPESYVYCRGVKGLLPYLSDGENAKLRIYEPPPFYSLVGWRYQDFPLSGEQ